MPLTDVILPSGVVFPFAGTTAPTGYLICDGSAVSRTTYAALFDALSTTYGAGDGSTTFNLPDMRGRHPAGKDNMGGVAANRLSSTTITGGANTLGNAGGVETYTLATPEIPVHAHPTNAHNHTVTDGSPSNITRFLNVTTGGGVAAAPVPGGSFTTSPAGSASTAPVSVTVNPAGGGAAHGNVQPCLILNYIVKT